MHIKVQKFDPSVDAEPYYAEGDIDYTEGMNGLQALLLFQENVGPVSFDMQCGGGGCGRCSMVLDGESCLACLVPLTDDEHTFEPLSGFPVIRDLIVDKSKMAKKYNTVLNRAILEPITADTTTAPNYDDSTKELRGKLESCVRCGVCQSVCPVHGADALKYVGPTIMMGHALRCFDEFDSSNRLAMVVADGMYNCILCGKCDEVCQLNIPHVEIYNLLRQRAEAAGLKPSYA